MIGLASRFLQKFGYTVSKKETDMRNLYPDIKDSNFWEIFECCQPFTMTSVDRMFSLYTAVNYIIDNNISGHFAECGVWRGGSSMMIASTLLKRGVSNKKIFLYDTFEGMSAPTNNDVDVVGNDAASLLKINENTREGNIWCLADLNDVQSNMTLTGYPSSNITYVKGKVEDTIPSSSPDGDIALLRLDTDWYESTKHELIHLYPQLVKNGVLIIDDYGHWEGCKKAVDEYFQLNKLNMLLNRIDYTGRIAIKTT